MATTESGNWSLRDEDLSVFNALDPYTRQMILRLLGSDGSPTEGDFEDLRRHPQGKALSSWLLSLPAYVAVSDDDE